MARLLPILLVVALAAPALPHEGGRHVKGVIKEISAQRIVIAEQAGRDATFAITKTTEFLRERKQVRWDDAKPGERVVVHGTPDGGAAAAVLLGPAPGGR